MSDARRSRAEAVERLRRLPPMRSTCSQYIDALIGPIVLRPELRTTQDVTAALIDLLTDGESLDCIPEGRETMRNCPLKFGECTENCAWYVFTRPAGEPFSKAEGVCAAVAIACGTTDRDGFITMPLREAKDE